MNRRIGELFNCLFGVRSSMFLWEKFGFRKSISCHGDRLIGELMNWGNCLFGVQGGHRSGAEDAEVFSKDLLEGNIL